MSLSVAFRAFFRTMFNAELSQRVDEALSGKLPAPTKQQPAIEEKKSPAKPQPPLRSDAVSLLSALQREARFVDFVKESLDGLSDAQIGGVVRDVHRDSAAVIERMFSIRPLREEAEGSPLEVPAGFDAAQFRLTGNVTGEPPYRGKLGHHGWKATKCELPSWSGTKESALVVSPADVEL